VDTVAETASVLFTVMFGIGELNERA
jgi:hypothetical protein